MKTIVILLILALIIYLATRTPKYKPNQTADKYFEQLKITTPTTEQEVKQIFGKIFNNYKTGATEHNIRSVYADKLYFNDTLKIIEDIDELVIYMTESAESVDGTTVEILDVIRGDEDYFIRWTMKMDLNIKGKESYSHSVGMSQLRFNEAGKITFQQDFWDSSEAFFEHIPVLGRFVKKVKTML